jgi:nucleotide-binding universal stress UspA family protein
VVPPEGSAAPQHYDVSAITAEETRRLATRLAPWREKYPAVDVRLLVRHGQPAAALVAESADAELLVVGSHGHSALHNLFLGSTCNTVLHHAGCPVAIVPTRRRGRSGGPS